MSKNTVPLAQRSDEEYCLREEFADFLMVTTRSVDRWIANRQLATYRQGRTVRIKMRDARAFEESGRVETTEAQAAGS